MSRENVSTSSFTQSLLNTIIFLWYSCPIWAYIPTRDGPPKTSGPVAQSPEAIAAHHGAMTNSLFRLRRMTWPRGLFESVPLIRNSLLRSQFSLHTASQHCQRKHARNLHSPFES